MIEARSMADDDEGSQSSEAAKPEEPEQKPEEPAEQADAPAEASQQQPQATLDESRNKAYFEQLEKNYYESANRSNKMLAQIQDRVAALQSLADQPVRKPPAPYALPAPPNQQQKGNLSEFIFNLLKFGALTAIAYGSQGRGYGHNAIWKGAIGAALEGWSAGRKDVSDKAMQLWEKNREVINDANRQQNERYTQLLNNDKLTLSQKMDQIHALSTFYGDYRTSKAAEQKNLMDLQTSIRDQAKLQHDKEEWENKHRQKIYDVLGKSNINAQYFEWVREKSGGKVNLTQNTSVEDFRKVTAEHPDWSFSTFLKEHDEEEIQKAAKKSAAEEEARVKAKAKADKEVGKENIDPNAPIPEDKAKEMRDKIFGGSD